jgi:hypothetical protein
MKSTIVLVTPLVGDFFRTSVWDDAVADCAGAMTTAVAPREAKRRNSLRVIFDSMIVPASLI